MIINEKKLIRCIEEDIENYRSSTDFLKSKLWQNIVIGLERTIEHINNMSFSCGYDEIFEGIDKESLCYIKKAVENKIEVIDREPKEKLFRVNNDGVYEYSRTSCGAQKLLSQAISVNLNYDKCEYGIDTIFVSKSQIKNYKVMN